MTRLAELERRLITTTDPTEHARVRQQIRDAGLVHVADALDRIAAKTTTR
ncbi:hypothetical protein [Micromonospora inyonensis]|uniref:Uncharacterized protein n=1 Tax=Micromonospora inyonensis TaxID=47866 RepID=A0A1C6RX25_9ACTN|nr:hypothetical protein [Micromonospora inyonensis]SCL21556.1 hypothetical protein GA0074694_3069 [Micromonospora inyonensis]SCL21769.1 hypothetical protein GA0074694_3141 [Micromonospora inyonensis]